MNFEKPSRMTRWVFLAALLGAAAVASSQETPELAAPPVQPVVANTAPLTDAELQNLLAPIALYPDALIAQILPASTYPMPVVSAQRWLQANPSPSEAAIDAQNLEPPIKAILHYPTVLAMMNSQLDWTQSLGVAFLNQQSDVMIAIQELRRQAQIAGALQSTAQQQVVDEDDSIEIVPVNPDVVYVPEYDPLTIYTGGVGLTFGLGYPAGLWLDNGVDWHHRWVAGGYGWNHGWDRPMVRLGGPPPLTRPWERHAGQPLPVVHRPIVVQDVRRVAPGYEAPRVDVRAPAAFGGYQNRATVERQVTRAQESRPAVQESRPVVRAAPAQVFHAEAPGRSVAAQSARGNASRAASSGGGGGRRR